MKNIVTILIAVIASVIVTHFLKDDQVTLEVKETAYERVMRTGVLRCGYNVWPPAVMVDANSGALQGIIPELIEYAAGSVGLKVEWTQQAAWGTFPEDLKNGRFDAMCAGAWETKEAAPLVAYTRPVFFNPVYAYVRADDNRFDNGLSILNSPEYKIATIDGTMSGLIADEDYPGAEQVSLPQLTDVSNMILNVVQNKADLFFNEPASTREFLKSNPGTLKRVSDEPHRSFASPLLGAYITEYELIRMFDTVLSEMILQGTVQRIIDKHEPDRSLFIPVAKPYEVK